MRLKTRLFVWIGSLFFLVFGISYVLEIYLTASSLKVGEQNLKQSLFALNEKKREDIQHYLTNILGGYQSKINALLIKVRDYPPFRANFIEQHVVASTDWLNAATLIMTDKWLDFVQTEKNGQMTSLIAINPSALDTIKIASSREGVNVVVTGSGKKLIGIPIIIDDFGTSPDDSHKPPKQLMQPSDEIVFLVLFDPATIKRFNVDEMHFKILSLSVNPLEPFLKWVKSDIGEAPFTQFLTQLKTIQTALLQEPKFFERTELQEFNLFPKEEYSENLQLNNELDRLDQIGLIWGLTGLMASGPFGSTPLGLNAPLGIARINNTKTQAKVIFNDTIFFKKLLIADTKPQITKDSMEDVLSVLNTPKHNLFFFGNTLSLKEGPTSTELTLGIDGSVAQKNLSLVTGKMSMFISGGKLLCTVDRKGNFLNDVQLNADEFQNMLQEFHGFVNIQGEKYYFMKMSVQSGSDFHFFLLTPEAEEFLLVQELNKDVMLVTKKISLQMKITAIIALLIVLIILDNLASKITQPISLLADATAKVKTGRLEDAELPQPNLKNRDEVYELYKSFNEMIIGLKEKEKVRAVLNKMVSPEVANEFLRQDPILGGEEKEVTVFFADIRSFTHITEKMQPQEVIKLLNTCMTIVSHMIDQYHGVIDKYVGDEVMALFGAPVARETSTIDAISVAIKTVDSLREWNIGRVSQGLPVVEMGFGIHTGRVVAGNMGAENRLNYTVLGSNVNLASRLCSVAKPMEILVSQAVVDTPGVSQAFEIEPSSSMELKGFSGSFKIFKILGFKQ